MLLGLILLLLRLLGLHLPVAGPKHGTVLVLVVISPVAGLVHLLLMQGKTKRGPVAKPKSVLLLLGLWLLGPK